MNDSLNLMIEFTAFECAEFPDVDFEYGSYKGKEAIALRRYEDDKIISEKFVLIPKTFECYERRFYKALEQLWS